MKTLEIYYTGNDGQTHMGFKNGIPRTINATPLALINKIIYTIKTRKGSDAFITNHGSYVEDILKLGTSADELEIQSRLTATIKDVENQITYSQLQDKPETMLKQLYINKIYRDPSDPGQYRAEIFVVTEANQNYVVTV